MYVEPNYPTKTALRKAVADGERVTVFQPGPFGLGASPVTGTVAVEGPHYPKPHKWYAQCRVEASVVVGVK